MPKKKNIFVSERDIELVLRLAVSSSKTQSGATLEYVRLLLNELQQANVVPSSLLPATVVALNSKVWLSDMDSGGKQVLTLVLPDDAGRRAEHISVMSPMGMALFGYSTGDRIEWGPIGRRIRLEIDFVSQIPSRHCASGKSAKPNH